MNDYFNIPQITNHHTFFALGSTVWQTWQKPKNSNFIYITALGGGAGGGGTPNNLGNVGGAGGGGSSSITKILLPTALIPDVLYINVGMGGIGGVGSNVGSDGSLSVISVEPNSILNNVIIKSGNDVAVGGGPGTTVGAGDSGVAGTVFISSVGYLSYLGVWSSYAGDDGGVGGGFGASGSIVNALSNGITTGGGGGGGKTNSAGGAGGSIIARGVLGRSAGGLGNVGGRGGNGLLTVNPLLLTSSSTKLPFATTGGAGGGSGADTGSVAGGTGGNGQYGSGGGGAGAGAGSPGGRGGNGGDGIVFITVF